MAGEQYSPESRKAFLMALGTYQSIADYLGLKDRRNVENWVQYGFAHVHKTALIKLAYEKKAAPHPELYTKRRHNVPSVTSYLGRYIHDLALKAGGLDELAKASQIPRSSLSAMTLKKGHLRRKYQPHFEYMSLVFEVPLPDSWEEIVEAATPKLKPKPEPKPEKVKRIPKRRLKPPSRAATS